MKKEIKNIIPLITLMMTVIMFSCTKNIKKDSDHNVPSGVTPTSSPVENTPQVSVELGVGKVNLIPEEGTPREWVEYIAKGEKKMNEVVHSQCLSDFLSKRDMIQTNNRTPEQVVKHLQSLNGNITVKLYYTRLKSKFNPFGTSAVAYRQPPSNDININTAYFTYQGNACEFSGTLAHESLAHSLGGYDHSYYDSSDREFSVPYSLNKAFEKCCH